MHTASHKKLSILLMAGVLCVLCTCCSLNYGKQIASEDGIPELVFNNANFFRLQDKKEVLSVTAGNLEIYKKGNQVYGSDKIVFTVIDEHGEVSAEGNTNLLLVDRETDVYSFLQGASISSYKNNVKVSAESFRWNNRTEQLTSGKDTLVTIVVGGVKDAEMDGQPATEITMQGRGFSASGASLQYRFEKQVQGTLKVAEDSVATPKTLAKIVQETRSDAQ